MDVVSGKVECIRRSDKGYEAMNILSHENHALYIKNIDMLQSKYQCLKCEMVFVSAERLKNHKKNQCELVNIESCPAEPTIYKPAQNAIRSLLTKYSIKNADQYIVHFIVYDFEAILKPTANQHGENTVFTNEHIPVSVSVADSLTEEVRCFVNDDPKMLLTDMFKYIGSVSVKIQQYNVNKYKSLLPKIINAHGLTGMEIPGVNLEEFFAVIGTDNIKSVIKNPSYMCIATSDMKMLIITNYVPAGTSYDKYLTTYLGGCKCDDKIRCVCGLGKGLFPYEYITPFNVQNQTTIPPRSAFDSKLRGTSITKDDYKRVKFVWEYYEMKSIKDLLIWYNNLDVIPFIKAIKAQRELFKPFDLDMFADGVSLPGLSEKVMYQTCFNNLQYPDKKPANAFQFPAKHMGGYKNQDAKAKRKFGVTLEQLNTLLQKQKYLCGLCYCQLTADTASADRINNDLGHIDGNILVSCVKCNTARKDMSLKGFRYKKLLEFNSDKLVYSIDKEEKNIYSKMKANIAGGPSIIFNRYAKRNETKIRGGKVCKKIIGYDANALYLWALGNEMPCGRLTTVEAYDGIIDDIKADKVFGFLECDIRAPEHLKQYFGEMTPIFKNVLIDCTNESVIGKHMFDHNEARKQSRAKPARKLIGSYFGEKILIYTPLLKWYLSHGMEITKTYCFVKASSHKAFAPFMEAVSNARREGDVDKSKAMIAEMMKLVGNSAFGRSGMDMSKHKELNDACEITMKKRRLNNKNPIHLSIAIYQLAKLRMLQYYYDCINFYFDRSDFQYQEMDTDSAYIAFSCENPFQDCIKPELRAHFKEHKYDWFSRDYNTEVAKFDHRTPGLFKDEWSDDAMVSLSSKNIFAIYPTNLTRVRPNITIKIVKEWYANQTDIQRFQDQKKRFDGLKKIASHNPNSWQMDLAFWEKRPILTAININSRLGYAKLSSNKTAATVLAALKAFVHLHTVHILTSDNGSEFMNSQAQEFFQTKKIEHYNNEPDDHGTMGKIERFNRILKQRLTKMSPKRITQKLITDVIENYNSTFHRSIKLTPNEAKGKVIGSELYHNQGEAERVENEFEVGANVLYRLKKQIFDKEAARWSKAVYTIVGIYGYRVQIR
ncbi:unnamed protein product [Phytophthora lilii]|uniref:Unnamed protein product n=1 Tax=Phytophthora lilii TaxID=2077276 RepID=A0A9W6TMU4_9STRA|nr:unnamed protein product [Phytophthora lilii]